MINPFATLALLVIFSTPLAADIENTVITQNLRDPMEIAIAPDGDLYVAEREGRVLRVRPSTGGVFEIGRVEVTALRASDVRSNWAREDGLLGLALDPAFATNRRLYLYYSHPKDLLNRLSRFELKDGLLDPASEKVLLDIPTDRRDRVCHQAGSIAISKDGMLYLATGDNTNPFDARGYSPIDDRDGREHANAMRSAGNTHDLRGKILRIRLTEEGYEIPEGNLFPPGTPKTKPEIYIMGCRNPFRISVDPKSNALYWGDVGPDARRAERLGPIGVDELNRADQAGNFGWPFVIGYNHPYPIIDFETGEPVAMTDPLAPRNPRRNHDGLVDLPPARPALLSYDYSEDARFPALGSGGRNAMAGPVFYHDPTRKFNILGKEDDHALLAYDWIRGVVWKAKLGTEGSLEKIETLIRDLNHPMDLEMAEDGTVWLLEYGTAWYINGNGGIRRLRPADGNQAPVVSITTTGNTHTATASDPDGEEVKIEWWLTDGPGETQIGSGPSITHDGSGAELRAVVTDAKGGLAIARIPLMEDDYQTMLEMNFAGRPRALTFGQNLEFTIVGAKKPAEIVVRARYIPPSGHDAGGLEFPDEIEKLIAARQCLACHQIDKPSVGPAYLDVALKYRGRSDAAEYLKATLKTGGGGVWGEIPMPAQSAVTEEEADALVQAILGLAQGVTEQRGTDRGSIVLSAETPTAAPGGGWEVTADAPGNISARRRFEAE
jgi:cytochrome c